MFLQFRKETSHIIRRGNCIQDSPLCIILGKQYKSHLIATVVCVSYQLLSYQTHQILKFLEQKPTFQTQNIYLEMCSECKELGRKNKPIPPQCPVSPRMCTLKEKCREAGEWSPALAGSPVPQPLGPPALCKGSKLNSRPLWDHPL